MYKKNYLLIALLGFLACDSEQEQVQITIIGEDTANIQAMMSLEDEKKKLNPNFALTPFVKNDYVHGLDELKAEVPADKLQFEADMYSEAWKELGYYYGKDGEGLMKVGYPFAINTMFLAYNKEMFEDTANKAAYQTRYGQALEVPKTWQDLVKVAAFFTDPDKGTHGICMQGDASTGTWLYYEFVNYLYGMGAKVMDKQYGWQGDENTAIELNSPEALAALELYLSLKPYNAGNYTTTEQFEQTKQLKSGKVAMAIVWSDVVYSAMNENGKWDERFAFAPVPGAKSFFAGGSFFLNKKSKHSKEVMDYVVYLMQPENQVKLAKLGLASPLRSTYADAGVQELPYIAALKESLDRGCYMLEAGPDADLIAQKIDTYVQKAWLGELTPAEALNSMQEEITTERKELFNAEVTP